MKLCFDSIQEVKDFVGSLKGVRGGKKDDGTDTDASTAALNGGTAGNTGNAPPPLMPPQGGPGGPAFAPGGPAAFAPPTGFPAAGGAPQLDPAVQGLITRICNRVDALIAQGQSAGDMLKWFQNQCGPEAANATLDQIKTVFLPKASQPTLDNMAKLVGA